MEALIPTSIARPLFPVLAPQEAPRVSVLPVLTAIEEPKKPATLPFILSNTQEVTMHQLREDCIVPVFARDNEMTIAHQDFIAAILAAAHAAFPREIITDPVIRASHIIKGRIPEAIHKPVNQLLESDKTQYFERLMFCAEIPSIHQDIDGCRLNLTIGGVRAYNEQNLYSRKSPEKFKVFIGFKNLVCCNLCVSTDGYKANLRVMDTAAMMSSAEDLFRSYDAEKHLALMTAFQTVGMSESQFAQFLGRCRLYQYLPAAEKKHLPELLLTDTQIGMVARAYFQDKDFGKAEDRALSLWQLHNLFTGANKSSYIDDFLGRAENATVLTTGLAKALHGDEEYSWFLS